MAEYVLGGFVLLIWAPLLAMGLGLVPHIIGNAGPYVFGQMAYYVAIPLSLCTLVLISLFHVHVRRSKPTDFDVGIYRAVYIVFVAAVVPYLFLYFGGM